MDIDFNYENNKSNINESFFNELKENGLKLKDADDSLKNNKQAVLIAVSQNGLALQYVNSELLQDEEVIITALNENIDAIKYVPEEMAENPKIVEIFSSHNTQYDKSMIEMYIKYKKNGLFQESKDWYNYCLNYLQNNDLNNLEDLKKVLTLLDYNIFFDILQMDHDLKKSNDDLDENLEEFIYKLVIKRLNQEKNGIKIGDILISECIENNKKIGFSLLRYDADKYFSKHGVSKMLKRCPDSLMTFFVSSELDVCLNPSVRITDDDVKQFGQAVSKLITLRCVMAIFDQQLEAKKDTDKGKFYRKVYEYEFDLMKNRLYYDGRITQYAGDMKSYDDMIIALQNDYKTSKTEELTAKLEQAKKDREIKYITEDLSCVENLTTHVDKKITKEYVDFAMQNLEKITEFDKTSFQEKKDESSDLDKLIKAIKITEDVFVKRGIFSPCDLGNYLETGNLNVFTEIDGARKLVEGIDYKKIREEVIMRMIDNTIKFFENGNIFPRDAMTCKIAAFGQSVDAIKDDDRIKKRSQAGVTITDIIDDLLKSHKFIYDYNLTKTLLGKIEALDNVREDEKAQRYANRLKLEKALAIKYNKQKNKEETTKQNDAIKFENQEESKIEVTEDTIKKIESENDGIKKDISKKQYLVDKYKQLLFEQKSLMEQQEKINSEFAQLAQMIANKDYTLSENESINDDVDSSKKF